MKNKTLKVFVFFFNYWGSNKKMELDTTWLSKLFRNKKKVVLFLLKFKSIWRLAEINKLYKNDRKYIVKQNSWFNTQSSKLEIKVI